MLNSRHHAYSALIGSRTQIKHLCEKGNINTDTPQSSVQCPAELFPFSTYECFVCS